MGHANLAVMHRTVAERLGPRCALRYKCYGLYRDVSWRAYRGQADRAAAALIELGIQPGDRIGILSENRNEWLVSDIAILSTGAADVTMHAPLSAEQVEYQLSHSEARGVVVSNQEQADKVLDVLDALPSLEFLTSFDRIEVGGRIRHFTWAGLIQRGQQLGAAGRERVLQRERSLKQDDLATLIYTSGTTGKPKGVMLTHGNLVSNAEAMLEVSQIDAGDILLSWLPYSHIYARTVDHYLTTLAEATVCLAESIDTLIENIGETHPTWITAVPRFYEKVWASVEKLAVDKRQKALRNTFGPRIKWLSSGGAPLPRHICQAFIDAGLDLMEGYGLTESSPVISFNRQESYKVGSVGQAVPGVEVRIADDGEILTRGPHVMKGYWKNPEATTETIVNGWLHTGDVGELDDQGFLTITDRKKDLIVTSSGKNVAPSEIERLLVSDPYIDQAVVHGDGRSFLTALLVPNFPTLEAKAQELGCELDVVDDLIQSEPIHDFLAKRVDHVMQSVSKPERVRKFLVLGRPLQLEAAELTATLKVRRREIIRKYHDRLDALYRNRSRE